MCILINKNINANKTPQNVYICQRPCRARVTQSPTVLTTVSPRVPTPDTLSGPWNTAAHTVSSFYY